MANIKSAAKRAQKAAEATVRNASVKSGFRTMIRSFNEALQRSPQDAEKMFPAVSAALDQAAGRGVIHPNTAARRKSRLARRLRKGLERD